MAHINSIKLKNKSYDKRKIVFSIDKRTYYVEPCWGWYSVSTSDIEVRTVVRDVVMNNLYWLLGKGCDIETWKESIEKWDKGKIYNTPINETPTSLFFKKEEKETAFNSFYNTGLKLTIF